MGKRIELREGQVFQKHGRIRRIVGIVENKVPAKAATDLFEKDKGVETHIFYSRGGEKRYRCRREHFLRWSARADEITGAEITVEGSLV